MKRKSWLLKWNGRIFYRILLNPISIPSKKWSLSFTHKQQILEDITARNANIPRGFPTTKVFLITWNGKKFQRKLLKPKGFSLRRKLKQIVKISNRKKTFLKTLKTEDYRRKLFVSIIKTKAQLLLKSQ